MKVCWIENENNISLYRFHKKKWHGNMNILMYFQLLNPFLKPKISIYTWTFFTASKCFTASMNGHLFVLILSSKILEKERTYIQRVLNRRALTSGDGKPFGIIYLAVLHSLMQLKRCIRIEMMNSAVFCMI